MNQKVSYLFLLLLIATICLSPRFSLGYISSGRSIDIRAEDVVLCASLVFWLIVTLARGQYKFTLPPLFRPIFAWSLLGISSILLNLLFGSLIPDKAFFYFLKEIEFFFLYFIIFHFVSGFNINKWLMGSWFAFSLINVFWIVYASIRKIGWSTYYGAESFIEPNGPFPSGGFFLMLFIFFFNIFLFYYSKLKISKFKKIIIFFLSVVPVIGIISSGSRASAVGLFASLLVSFFLFFGSRINFNMTIKLTTTILLIVIVFLPILSFSPASKRVVDFGRMIWEYTSNNQYSRIGILKNNLINLSNHPHNLLIGFGIFGEAHSQYMRIFLERGILGLAIFLWLVLCIVKICWRSFKKDTGFSKGLSAGLFVATIVMLIMSVPNDPFSVVKIAEVYWSFVAISMAVIKFSSEIKGNSLKNIDVAKEAKSGVPTIDTKSISAIIVAHDPEKDFSDNLKITANQVDKIVVVNNGSSKINKDFFNNNELKDKIILISNQNNLGLGRALNQGAGWCVEHGYKWVLLLDQDSKVDPLMIQEQIKAYEAYPFKNLLGIVGVNCIYKGTNEIKYHKTKQNFLYFERDVVMTSGMLLSVDTFLKTGQFRDEFFIDSIDVDYCLRLRKSGFKIIVAYNAMMLQRVGQDGKIRKFLWKKILVTNHSAQRCYYMTRNGLILVKEYFLREPFWCFRRIVWYFLVKPLFVIFYEDDKFIKIKSMALGMAHAVIGKTGENGE